MLEFIQLLNQRYRTVLQEPSRSSVKTLYQQRIDQLVLAEAFLRKGQLVETTTDLPLQIAVIGPTQSGKSTLVNVLLQADTAGVSPLAGYTVHPQGFCHDVSIEQCAPLQRYFGKFQQLPPSQLSKERYDCYSLSKAPNVSDRIPPCVLWDTPDFDSIDSAIYREGVIRTVALADILLLVISKEKYADQTVWTVMSALEALHQPVLICLNKLAEGSESLIINSLKDKWQLSRTDEFPEVIPLLYQKQSGMPVWPRTGTDRLAGLSSRINHKKQGRFEQEMLQKNWSSWLEPVVEEHQASKQWHEQIEAAMKQALIDYQRDFLNHPHHYETFQCALAELLTLLEIPGLAGLLASTRKVLTWPVKQLLKIGRKHIDISDSSYEVALLNQIAEHTLIQLTDQLIDQNDGTPQRLLWKELSGLLRNQRQDILKEFDQAARAYHLAFQQDVETAARRLYHKLQEQPLVLNSLRATRVTTDAAVIALALHTGGIGIHDLVIAPSMLTITSLLAESAVGGYMHRVEAELKRQQLETVSNTLFDDLLRNRIVKLAEQLSTTNYFHITPDQVQTAERQLKEKRHGLRLL